MPESFTHLISLKSFKYQEVYIKNRKNFTKCNCESSYVANIIGSTYDRKLWLYT